MAPQQPIPLPARRPKPSDLLTLDEALAEMNDVSRSTFFRWKALGKAPRTIKYPNGSLRIRRAALDAWLAEREEAA